MESVSMRRGMAAVLLAIGSLGVACDTDPVGDDPTLEQQDAEGPGEQAPGTEAPELESPET